MPTHSYGMYVQRPARRSNDQEWFLISISISFCSFVMHVCPNVLKEKEDGTKERKEKEREKEEPKKAGKKEEK